MNIENLLHHTNFRNRKLRAISEKILSGFRLTAEEGLLLYAEADLPLLGSLANFVKTKQNGNKVWFNKNFHIEPTNICVYKCKFCSYSRKSGEDGSWEYTLNDIEKIAENYSGRSVTEVHIVGGVHPARDLHYYGEMIQRVKKKLPHIHVKAFTAVELDFMIKKAGMNLADGLKTLKNYGLDSIPGGGAEIFDPEIRKQISHEKSSAERWLEIHKQAHLLGIPSNATMLYGHIENYKHRIDHLEKLRELQDQTGGFNTFIPLKYRKANNQLSAIGEVSLIEDLKNYAVSRLFLDNFEHIKAYWVMIGIETTGLALAFGVDDIDGTIDDTTKIYSMAGAESEKQGTSLSTNQLVNIIKNAGFVPVERDTLYNEIRNYA